MTTARKSHSWSRFLIPFCLQLAIILIVPAQSAYTFNFGKSAVLQTMPIDPYDLLRGYSQSLSYDLSQASSLQKFFGGENLVTGKTIYVILEPNETKAIPPKASKIIKVTSEIPSDLAVNQVALRGKLEPSGQVIYGLERYYLPESQRNKINQEINSLANDSQEKTPFLVEIKVDRWGNPTPASLWIGQSNISFKFDF